MDARLEGPDCAARLLRYLQRPWALDFTDATGEDQKVLLVCLSRARAAGRLLD